MTLLQILNDPFSKLITIYEIAEIHGRLLEPFRVYGNLYHIYEDHPDLLIEMSSRQFDGRMKGGKKYQNDQGHVEFEPAPNDIEQIEQWHKIAEIHRLLVALQDEQIKLRGSSNNLENYQIIKSGIEKITHEIQEHLGKAEYNLSNTHVECQTIPTSRDEYERLKSLRLEVKEQRKRLVIVFENGIQDILNHCLRIGISRLEFEAIKACFSSPSIINFDRSKYRRQSELEVDVDSLTKEVFDIANLFQNIEIQRFFLEQINRDAQKQNSQSHWTQALGRFNQQFEDRKIHWTENVDEKKGYKGILGYIMTNELVNECFLEYSNIADSFRIATIKEIQEIDRLFHDRTDVYSIKELLVEIDKNIIAYRKSYDTAIRPSMNWFDVTGLSGQEQKERELFESKSNIKFLQLLKSKLTTPEEFDGKDIEKQVQKTGQPTFLDLFHNNKELVEIFKNTLMATEKVGGLGAVDNNLHWIWKPQNSICCCLDALFSLSKDHNYKLVNHGYENQYRQLYEMVSSELTIQCKYENFRKWSHNINRMVTFKKKFKAAFADFLK